MSPSKQMRGWLASGTERFDTALAELPDSAFAEPSLLPSWLRAHVIAHVAANAEALTRLCRWAASGVEQRMYADAEQRAREISEWADQRPAELRERVAGARDTLASAMGVLDSDGWSGSVVTAQGRTVPASEIVWMRVREVWIHSVDLGTGVGFDDFPAELLDALIEEIAGLRGRRGGGPNLVLSVEDRGRRLVVPGDGNPVIVDGSAAEIAALLAGRGASRQPDIGPWI